MTTIDLKDAGAHFEKLAGKRRDAAIAGCRLAAARCVQTIVATIIPSRDPPPVDRGIYRAGWKTEVLPEGAAFFNDSPAAAIIERGARGENIKIGRKLIDALAAWVRRKGIAKSKTEAVGIAWAIAKKAAAGAGFHNRRPGGGQQIMGDCNKTYTRRYMKAEVERKLERL